MNPLREIIAIFTVRFDDRQLKKGEKSVKRVGASLKRLGSTLVGVFGARAIFRGLQNTANELDRLAKLARGLGLTAQELQQIEFTLDRLGGDPASIRNLFVSLNKALGEAETGSKEYVDSFLQIGVNFRDLGKLKPVEQFLLIRDAMEAAGGSAQSVAGASIVLGRGFKSNLPVFKATAAEVRALIAEQQQLGGFTDAQADLGEKVADTQRNLEQVKKTLQGKLFEVLGPGIIEATEGLTRLISNLREADQLGAVLAVGGFGVMIAAIAVLVGAIGGIATAIAVAFLATAAGVATMIAHWAEFKQAIDVILSPLGQVGQILAEIAKFALNPLGRIFDLVKSVGGSVSESVANANARSAAPSLPASGFSKNVSNNTSNNVVNIDAAGLSVPQIQSLIRDENQKTNRTAQSRG